MEDLALLLLYYYTGWGSITWDGGVLHGIGGLLHGMGEYYTG